MTRTANDNSNLATPHDPDDNIIQPFQLEVSGLRGRVVRLGDSLNNLLCAHDYPTPVAMLLAETMVTAVLLASMLKYEGVFTLQTSGDGPARTMVADMTTAGSLRGYVGYNDDTIKAMQCAETKPEGGAYDGFHLSHLTGKGYLAFTVDQGEFMERYQGIVALSGDTITQSVQHYFNQSEQIGACLKVAVSYTPANGWRAGGIMLQRMPDASITATDQETVVPFKPELIDAQEEDWARANILLQSITDAELVQPDLHSHDILLRLFHEEGVRIFETSPVINQCRCSTERVAKVLATLSEDDRTHAAENGIIKMTCEFCSQKYHFDAETLSCIDVTPPQTTH